MTALWKARPDKPEYDEMRTRLVAAANEIVRESGVAALRLDSVATRVGVHRSSVYRYFDRKEDLITAVVVDTTLRVGSEVIDDLGTVDDPEVLLVDGIARSLTKLAADPVHQSLMEPSASEAVARTAARVLDEALPQLVAPLVEAAAARGGLRQGVTEDDAMRWLVIVASGLVRSRDVVADDEHLRALLTKMLVPVILRVA